MPPKHPQNLVQKLVTAVRNDPQKAGVLTVLVAVLVVLQVRLQMSSREGAARATTTTPHASAKGARPDNGGASGASVTATSHSIKPQDGPAALRAWMEAPPAPLTRNLFAVDLERFPHDGGRPVGKASDQGFWDELAKSMSFRADVRKERQILIENLARQASELRLQSTVMGASPKAVINGDLVEEGDVVASFRVLKIEARRIIVEREGIKLEIQMK